MLPTLAQAGIFVMVKGRQYELCGEYAENLKASPALSAKTGAWPLDPKLTSFSLPQWETVDVRQHSTS